MAFTAIRLYHFRNLADTTISTDAREIFLVGENGQGKTNFLEAVYFVCYASSFRTRRDEVMRTNGTEDMAVEGRFQTDAEPRSVLVKQVGRRKQIELDGAPVDDRKEIISNIPCIVFCHDDIAFVAGGPEMQRWFMNQTQSLLSPAHILDLRRYRRVLKARNAALRDRRTDLLHALDRQLAQSGILIQARRASLAVEVNRTLSSLFLQVFGSDRRLTVTYEPSWTDAQPPPESPQPDLLLSDVLEDLHRSRDRDIDQRTSTRGPHRDRFVFRLDGRPLTDVASTGQLRLVSLILRVVQARLLSDVTGRLPVLLLDDVLLELDPDRRHRFVDLLPAYDQAFFTFLPDEHYSRFRRDTTRLYEVCRGVIS